MEHSESRLRQQSLIGINVGRFSFVVASLVLLITSLYRQIRTVHHLVVLYDVMRLFHSSD